MGVPGRHDLRDRWPRCRRRLFRRKLGLPRVPRPAPALAQVPAARSSSSTPSSSRWTGRDVADFLDSPYNRVADVKMLYFFERLSPLALKVILGLVVALGRRSRTSGAATCAPTGRSSASLSLLSPLKVTRDARVLHRLRPVHEGLPLAPPGGERLARVSSDECFGCLSCVAACPVTRALRVETPAPWRRAVRPAAFAALVVGLFVGGVLLARATGHWRNAISDEEYARRIRDDRLPGLRPRQGARPVPRGVGGRRGGRGRDPCPRRGRSGYNPPGPPSAPRPAPPRRNERRHEPWRASSSWARWRRTTS